MDSGKNESAGAKVQGKNAEIKQEPQEKIALPPWKWPFRPNEHVSLLSDDEGDDDLPAPPSHKKSAFGTAHDSPMGVSKKGLISKEVAVKAPPAIDQSKMYQMILDKQRAIAEKFRTKQLEKAAPQVEEAALAVPDSEAEAFQGMRKAYAKKKRTNQLTEDDEIAMIRAESKESSRLQKRKADEAFLRAESPTRADDGGLFVSDDESSEENIPRFEADEPKRKKFKGKARQITPSDPDDFDVQSESPQPKNRKKATKKSKVGSKDEIGPKITNLKNLTSTNLFEDTAAVQNLPSQPTFQTTGRREDALKELIASVPEKDRKIAGDDSKLLRECIKSFTGSEHGALRPEGDGTWLLKGMRTSLKAYQVQAAAFMRDRENASHQPKGGILADQMGLGKTVEVLACIVNGVAPETKKHRTTLIVAAPAIVKQWFNEIRKHCIVNNKPNTHGIGQVIQWRSGHRPATSNPAQMLLDHGVVLTTYNEVCGSFPTNEPPDEIVDLQEKEQWRKDNFEQNRGLLHSIKFHRVVLDEAQAIKNHNSRTSRACRALKATHYWAVTGTPMYNSTMEFYPYFDFIREPSAGGGFEIFKNNFGGENGTKGPKRLDAILGKVMCRRTHKDTIFGARLLDLPQPVEQTHWLQFNEIERQIYNIVENRFIKRINKISADGELDRKYGHIFTMLTRLRQLCSHTLLIQGTITDLLEREDYELLNDLVQDETELSSHGASLLIALRSTFANQAGGRPDENQELGQNIIETATRPIDLVEFEDIEGQFGGKHGLAFRFGKYLHSLHSSRQFDAMLDRSRCCACIQQPLDPYVTDCYHIYCKSCLHDLQQFAARKGQDSASCTACGKFYKRAEPCVDLEKFTIDDNASTFDTGDSNVAQKSKKEAGEVEDWLDIKGEVLPSAKTIAVKAQIIEWRKEDVHCKIIVFTQFLPMIKILSRVCATEGWSCVKYHGEMSVDSREKAIEEFTNNKEKTILLASLRACGLGLNLTAASRVISVDPYFNLAMEMQAFSRIFRIGQNKETRFTRLAIKSSVDQRLQDIKKRKQIEIDDCLAAHHKQEKIETHELLRLFGQVKEDEDGRPFILLPNETVEEEEDVDLED